MRVYKVTAERMYNKGFKVGLIPCKVNPRTSWGVIMKVSKTCGRTFKSLADEFEYRNCNSAEVGYYPAYYVDDTDYMTYMMNN